MTAVMQNVVISVVQRCLNFRQAAANGKGGEKNNFKFFE